MNNEKYCIKVNSFNSRGLRNKCKRNNIFKWLKTSHHAITMIQGMHAIATDHD